MCVCVCVCVRARVKVSQNKDITLGGASLIPIAGGRVRSPVLRIRVSRCDSTLHVSPRYHDNTPLFFNLQIAST